MLNRRGFSLLELMVAVGLLSFVVLAIAGFNLQMHKQQAQGTSLVQIDVFRRNLISLTFSQKSWKATTAAGSAGGASPGGKMDCLSAGTSCSASGTPVTDQVFAIYDASGKLYYDATNPANGLTAEGQPCSNFTASGNPQCPLRFDLKWSAVCTGACVNPQVKVNAKLLYPGTSNQLVINAEKYSVPDIFRSAQ